MDIRDWPLNRIMQLPDNCFGRRFVVSCHTSRLGAANEWDISELGLPEICVLWELFVSGTAADIDKQFSMRLALGDVLPTTTAEMDALEPLIPGLGITGAELRMIEMYANVPLHLVNLKYPIHAAGRRLVVENTGVLAGVINVLTGIVVSSIPAEVPDWLSVHQ